MKYDVIWLFGTYLFAAVLTWTYFIALAIEQGEDRVISGAIFFGWIAGIFWPMVVTTNLWLWLWF